MNKDQETVKQQNDDNDSIFLRYLFFVPFYLYFAVQLISNLPNFLVFENTSPTKQKKPFFFLFSRISGTTAVAEVG